MPGHRLLAVVTALVLAAGSEGHAQDYALDELLQVERLILAKDIRGLLNYLDGNPHLMTGSDPFAVEMRTLKTQLETELRDQFRATRNVFFESSQSY